jgi:hypothetical protein
VGLSGRKTQSIGLNYQALALPFGILRRWFHDTEADEMPKEDNNHIFEGCEPSSLFRDFAAECIELAQAASSPEKRALYAKMASVWHQMAQRWEKKG